MRESYERGCRLTCSYICVGTRGLGRPLVGEVGGTVLRLSVWKALGGEGFSVTLSVPKMHPFQVARGHQARWRGQDADSGT